MLHIGLPFVRRSGARLDERNVLKGMLRVLENDVISPPGQIEAEINSATEGIKPTEAADVEVVGERKAESSTA